MPGIELAAEDYRRLARLAKTDAPPTVELTSAVRYYDDDHNAYHIIAEIPGRDPKAGYVMAGAHLDSWVAGDGAADNGAGTAVVMEAARTLSATGVRPKCAHGSRFTYSVAPRGCQHAVPGASSCWWNRPSRGPSVR